MTIRIIPWQWLTQRLVAWTRPGASTGGAGQIAVRRSSRMSSRTENISVSSRWRTTGVYLALLAVLTVAVGLRVYRLDDWSLWEDEGTSLYFSQHPEKPFASYFPVFFVLL